MKEGIEAKIITKHRPRNKNMLLEIKIRICFNDLMNTLNFININKPENIA
jgi:hypothetical protein